MSQILDGKKVAQKLKDELKIEIENIKSKFNRVPGLAVVQVGNVAASSVYVKAKTKNAKEVGIEVIDHHLNETVSVFSFMEFSSKLIENAVNEISNLPGIGKKTALRLVLHLLKQPKSFSINLSNAISEMRLKVNFCKNCHNISDTETCQICSNPKRDNSTICVVEDIRDVIAIEKTSSFNGIYHVLGGKISPLDGIGPDDLTIESLVNKIKDEKIKEVIFALSTTMEGDTTNFYIYRKISDLNVITSTIARGVSVGDNLEYTDEVTLGRSISERIPFIKSISG